MLRTFVGLIVLAMLILPATAQDVKKPVDVDKDAPKKKIVDVDKDPAKKKTTDVDKDEAKAVSDSKKKLVSTGKMVGKVTQIEGITKNLTIDVTVKIQVPNPSGYQTMLNYQRQLAEASADRDPRNRARRLAEIQLNMQRSPPQMYKVESRTHKFELQAADEMKVRTMFLPQEYDDKGKPRQYTKKELAELKGPDLKLPGFTTEFDSLRTGQEVEVTVVRPKAIAKPRATKDKDRDFVAEDERMKATLIVILAEPKPR